MDRHACSSCSTPRTVRAVVAAPTTRVTGMLSLLALAGCRIDPPNAAGYEGEDATTSIGLGSETAGLESADSQSMESGGTGGTGGSMSTGSMSTGSMSADASSTDTESTSGSSSGTESSTGTDPICGDGVADAGEPCDGVDLGGASCTSEGFDAGTLGCLPDCTGYETSGCVTFECGNDAIEGSEACDGTDLAGSDCLGLGFDAGTLGCLPDCTAYDMSGCVTFTCGNGVLEGAETCDGIDLAGSDCVAQGFDAGTLSCMPNCTAYDTSGCVTFECGNGVPDPGEECDSGGESPGCDADCTFAMCGDSTINASLGEACDGGNLGGQSCASQSFDGGTLECNDSCQFDTVGCHVCGDAVLNGTEQCDDGDLGAQTCVSQGFDGGSLSCFPGCVFDTAACFVCGDGSIEGDEVCDGANLGGATCDSLGLFGGTLACGPSCTFDFTSCDVAGVPFGSDAGYIGYEAQPPALPCDDISGTGTPTLLSDDTVIGVPMGFTFPVYGVDHTEVAIESNGALHWGDFTYLTYGNTCLPSTTEPSLNNLYVLWDDLNPGVGTSEVYYQTLGPAGSRRFVVQWDTAFFGGDALDYIRVQAMLYEASGHIGVCYVDTISAGDARNSGAGATAGIQQSSMIGFGYSCDTPDLTDGLLLLYAPVGP